MNNFNEIYLNNIIEEAYKRPLLGWSAKNFEKTITKKLLKHIKGGLFGQSAFELFNNYFVSKKLFDFKKFLDSKPEIESSGEGTNLLIKVSYSIELNEDEAKKFFIGIEKDGQYKDKGILWNKAFADDLDLDVEEEETLEEDIEPQINESSDTFKYVYLNNIINEGLFGFGKKDEKKDAEIPPLDDMDFSNWIAEDNRKKITIIFEFDGVDYCKNFKSKEHFNLNRLSGMDGTIFMIIGNNEPIELSESLKWQQKRTEDMDPPKPIKDEIKAAWSAGKNGQGAGLVGLAAKKLIGGAIGLGTGLNAQSFNVIQNEDFEIKFNNVYHYKNAESNANSKVKKISKADKDKNALLNDKIEEMLSKASGDHIDWFVEKDKDVFTCIASFKQEDIISFQIKL